jgi:hypothetical protein
MLYKSLLLFSLASTLGCEDIWGPKRCEKMSGKGYCATESDCPTSKTFRCTKTRQFCASTCDTCPKSCEGDLTEEVKSFRDTPVPSDSDILAYYVWLNRYTLGTVSLSDKTDPYTSCRDVLKNQYSSDALVEVHIGGAPTDPPSVFGTAYPATMYGFPEELYGGVGALPLADCVLWNTVTHYDWGGGTNAAKNVRTCAGTDGTVLFKAEILPYKNGAGNFLQLPPSMFEVTRYSFVKGQYLSNGEFQATNMVMGIAAPMDLSVVDFAADWTCSNDGYDW